MSGRGRALRDLALWLLALAAVTAAILPFRARLDKAHVAMVLLLVTLGASAAAGRAVGMAVACVSFLAFNWFFLPPYHTFAVADPLDWLVLVTFLVTSAVAAQLLHLARQQERLAAHAEALREADRLKDALLASVSHDLRTPLTTIKARANELRVYGDEGAEVIEQEADRLNRMVADLLDLSLLNEGALRVAPELNAVDELVELAVQRVEGALGGRPLRVRLAPDGGLLFGCFDLAHSVRIVVNLAENAHKYAPAGTPVEIAAGRRGPWVEVIVADQGPGLAPGDEERAFEPFRRAAGAPPDVGGSGLGLAIARRLAEAQGGRLEYRPRPGGGSVFALSLPALDATADGFPPSVTTS
ncbi:MAG: DUF4118 domain-containing protein [Gemmatimonadaceae bacterium]